MICPLWIDQDRLEILDISLDWLIRLTTTAVHVRPVELLHISRLDNFTEKRCLLCLINIILNDGTIAFRRLLSLLLGGRISLLAGLYEMTQRALFLATCLLDWSCFLLCGLLLLFFLFSNPRHDNVKDAFLVLKLPRNKRVITPKGVWMSASLCSVREKALSSFVFDESHS